MSMYDFYGGKKRFLKTTDSHLSSLVQSGIHSLSRALASPTQLYKYSSSNPILGQSFSHSTVSVRVLHFILETILCGNKLVHINNIQDS